MSNKRIDNQQGHWILAKMGKKVLRPGGKELTLKMIESLQINTNDDIVEFAPGLGFTASITLGNNPKSYTGVEINEEAAEISRNRIKSGNSKIIVGNANKTNLESSAYTKIYGEAMLTMQPDKKKTEIIREAHRLLKPGGLYGIHELGLTPDDISDDMKQEIHKELIRTIKVNARPLSSQEWQTLLENEGFTIEKVATNPMHLLETKRMIDDEGFFRTLKIGFNILTHSQERKRILAMREVFKKYENNLNSVAIVARKRTDNWQLFLK